MQTFDKKIFKKIFKRTRTVFYLGISTFALLCLNQTTVASIERNSHAVSKQISSNYVISPNDLLHISVFQEDDLERRIRVSKDGTINYPLLGVLKIGGKTVDQATAYIQALLQKDYLVSPHVTIAIEEYSKQRFAVLGQVQQPGYYEIPHEETVNLLQAIAMAGGYTRIANPGSITVKRSTPKGTKVFRLNAKEMARRGETKTFVIRPNDTITVGESMF